MTNQFDTSPQIVAGVHEGALLAGKYRIEKILGTGGMGVVMAAFHVHYSVLHAAETTRNLLVFSRRDQPETQATSLDESIVALMGTLKEALPESIKLTTQLASTRAIRTDSPRIRQSWT